FSIGGRTFEQRRDFSQFLAQFLFSCHELPSYFGRGTYLPGWRRTLNERLMKHGRAGTPRPVLNSDRCVAHPCSSPTGEEPVVTAALARHLRSSDRGGGGGHWEGFMCHYGSSAQSDLSSCGRNLRI